MKRIKIIKVLILLLFAAIPISVHASIDCSDISQEVNNYNNIVAEMEELDCEEVYDSEEVKKCNDYNTKKSYSLSKIFSYYYNDNIDCNKYDLKVIVEENRDECTSVFGTELKDLAHAGLNFFYIAAPFLLLIFGSIDFAKIVVMNDPKTIKESRTKFIKRLISFILVIMLPLILNMILNFNITNLDYTSEIYSCKKKLIFQVDKWSSIYVPSASDTGGSSGRIVTGGIRTDEEAERLNEELNKMLNTQYHFKDSAYQSGPFPPEYNVMEPFQCTWYAQGRATQFLKSINSKYSAYPVNGSYGNGGEWYQKNVDNGWFNYGSTPKPNSVVSWKHGQYGHVAYVEGVGSDGIYISHAGSGKSWFGVQKIPLDGSVWSGYSLNGYIYLDEPR